MEELLPMPLSTEYVRLAGQTFYIRGLHPVFSDRYMVSFAYQLRGAWYYSTSPVTEFDLGLVHKLREKHGVQRVTAGECAE